MALSAAAHHSFGKVAAEAKYSGLREQKTDRAEAAHNAPRRPTSGAARGPELFQLLEEEVAGLQERVQRHAVEHLVDFVPQTVEQLVEVFRLLDTEVPEQVIDVPWISQDRIQQRFVDRDLRHP